MATMDIDAAREWRRAVHEAGHAVAARLLGLPNCGDACVEPGDAHARFPCDDGDKSVVALMAGSCAELEIFGDYDRAGCRADAGRVGARMAFGDHSALWHYTIDHMVKPHVGLISFIAHRLACERVLEGPVIDGIFADWVEPESPP